MAIKSLQPRNVFSDLYTVFLFTRSDIRICLIPVVSAARQRSAFITEVTYARRYLLSLLPPCLVPFD